MKIILLINNDVPKKVIDILKDCKFITYNKVKIKGVTNYILEIVSKTNKLENCEQIFDLYQQVCKILSDSDIKFELLNNEFSEYFLKILYPKFQYFEINLRKLLNIALSDTNDKLKEATTKLRTKLQNKKDDLLLKYSLFECSDLSDIFNILFSDDEFVEIVKKSGSKNFCTRNEFSQIPDKSLWNTELKKLWPKFKLDSYCRELYGYRNDIMHFHNINYTSYKNALQLINLANRQLNNALKDNIVIEPEKVESNPVLIKSYMKNLYSQIEKSSSILNEFLQLEFIKELREKTSPFNKYLQQNIKQYQKVYDTLNNQIHISIIKNKDLDYIKNIRNLLAHMDYKNILDEDNESNDKKE